MKGRSLLVISLCLLLAGLLFGCGNEPAPTSTDTPPATTEPETPASTPEIETPDVETPEVESPETPAAVDAPSTEDDGADIPADAVALLNGRPISQATFNNTRNALVNQYQQIYAQFGQDIRAMLTGAQGRIFQLSIDAEAMERSTVTSLMEAEAERVGIVISQATVNAEFEAQYQAFLSSQGATEEQLIDYLVSQGSSLEAFKENGRESVGAQLLAEAVQRSVAGEVEVTDEAVAAYFEENRDEYNREERARASHILVETRQEAEDLLDQLASGADFAALAIEHSTDTGSGPRGGDLSWFGRGQMVTLFDEAAFALEIGELSDVVETQFGFHIILKTDYEEAFNPELSDVLDQVRADAEDQVVLERAQQWYTDARAAAEFVVLLPLVDATLKQAEDIDLGLAAFEQIRDEGTEGEIYLSFIIGNIYETKMKSAQSEKDELLAANPDETPDTSDLDAQIEAAKESALANFRMALDENPGNAEIQARIDALAPAEETEEDTTP